MKMTQKREIVLLVLFLYPLFISCIDDWISPEDFSGWLKQVFYVWAKDLVFWFFIYLACLFILHELCEIMTRENGSFGKGGR